MGQSADGRRHVTADLRAVDDTDCTILHVDMDAFFAAVELRRRPDLRGVPMMVAGDSRSVVLSATYEARQYGVRSAMPVGAAKRLCPGIVVIPPDHQAYRAASADVMALFADVTPLVEPLSVDEAFLDVAGARRTHGSPSAIAVALRERIRTELGLTATVGASSTKFVAKLASGLAKPDGLLLVPPDQVAALLNPLPLRALWGVGPKTARHLESLGFSTVGELAATNRAVLVRALGDAVGGKLHDLANGRDDRRVEGDSSEVSIGAETTFDHDTGDRRVLSQTLLKLADRTASRARAAGQRGRTVSLKLRWSDFTTITRAETLTTPTDTAAEIHETVVALLDRVGVLGRRVRLLGVRLENLVAAGSVTEQLSLEFPVLTDRSRSAGRMSPGGAAAHRPARQQWRTAEGALDEIQARFGSTALGRASALSVPPTSPEAAHRNLPADRAATDQLSRSSGRPGPEVARAEVPKNTLPAEPAGVPQTGTAASPGRPR